MCSRAGEEVRNRGDGSADGAHRARDEARHIRQRSAAEDEDEDVHEDLRGDRTDPLGLSPRGGGQQVEPPVQLTHAQREVRHRSLDAHTRGDLDDGQRPHRGQGSAELT